MKAQHKIAGLVFSRLSIGLVLAVALVLAITISASQATSLFQADEFDKSLLTEFPRSDPGILKGRSPAAPSGLLFPHQWHHENTGQNGGTIDADVDTPEAWSRFTAEFSSTAMIAVIDDGFDLSHEDLAPNLFTNPGEIPGDWIDDDGNGYIDDHQGWDFVPCDPDLALGCGDNDPSPDGPNDNHGTAMAGVAAARMNGLGVIGACPFCRILPIRIAPGASSAQTVAYAFDYAKDMGADVIIFGWSDPAMGVVHPEVRQAIDKAVDAGSVVFVAAGDSNSTGWCGDSYPALENVIAVSSSTNWDQKLGESAIGSCVDILAPSHHISYTNGISPTYGTLDIVTTDRTGSAGFNHDTPLLPTCPIYPATFGDNYTSCYGGTSSAAALAGGIAGLVRWVDPTLTSKQVQYLLQDTADKIEPDDWSEGGESGIGADYATNTGQSNANTHGWGRVNALEAVRVVAPTNIGGGGRGGVDIFLRDNWLDWGNTTGYDLGGQSSATLFRPIVRGGIKWWLSEDIKVDAFPYQTPPTTAATFDAFTGEAPSTVDKNKVYVRVRNRGPVTAMSVTVKLHWAQFGTALPSLPTDFWNVWPNDSLVDTSQWHPMKCGDTSSSYCTIPSLPYSGSSVAGTPGDAAQIVQFSFSPTYDPALANHFCLLGIIDSDQDPIDPNSTTKFVANQITPNDNNVTHRNYKNMFTFKNMIFVERFFVRNPYDEPIRTALRLDAPGALEQGWEIWLDGFDFDEPFRLQSNEQALVSMTVMLPELNQSGEVTIIQERLDTPDNVPEVMGGVTFGFRSTFQVYLPLVLRAAPVTEIIKDASNLIHQVQVDENGPGFDYEVDEIPKDAFSEEPIDPEPKDDEVTPKEPERIHPVLPEMIGEDPSEIAPVIIVLGDDVKSGPQTVYWTVDVHGCN